MEELINKQEIIHYIDSTPNETYVLRILQAYRQNCNFRYSDSSDGSCENPVLEIMNELQEKRAELLDKAIEILSDHNLIT